MNQEPLLPNPPATPVEEPPQDAAIRAEEVAAYQAQLEPPQGQQPALGCAMPSDLFRSKSEDLDK